MTALDEQSVTVPGTAGAEMVRPRLADSLREVLQQRDRLAAEVDWMRDAHPLAAFAALTDSDYDRERA